VPEISGAIAYRALDDGRELVLYPMLFGNVRLCLGPQGWPAYDAGWCYQAAHRRDAAVDLATWDGNGDPPGQWIKRVGE
jgi:hypothetical protein